MNSLQIVYTGNKKTILGKVPKIGTIKVDGYKKPLTSTAIKQIERTITNLYGYSDVHILNYFELGEDFNND